jgi:hypothetical protein
MLLRIISIVILAFAFANAFIGPAQAAAFMPPPEVDLGGEEDDETTARLTEPAPRPLTLEEELEIAAFQEPKLTDDERNAIIAKYSHLDKKRLVPRLLLKEAIIYYDVNLELLKNKTYLTVIDYSPHSKNERMFIIEVATGEVWGMHVAHGSGSDKKRTGYASKFSNVPGSNQSTLGFVRTAETYIGKHGISLRLDGLSDTNSKMRDRAIVLHGAKYVWDQNVKQGVSWGCPAVSMKNYKTIVELLKEGSLIYLSRSWR